MNNLKEKNKLTNKNKLQHMLNFKTFGKQRGIMVTKFLSTRWKEPEDKNKHFKQEAKGKYLMK